MEEKNVCGRERRHPQGLAPGPEASFCTPAAGFPALDLLHSLPAHPARCMPATLTSALRMTVKCRNLAFMSLTEILMCTFDVSGGAAPGGSFDRIYAVEGPARTTLRSHRWFTEDERQAERKLFRRIHIVLRDILHIVTDRETES